MKIFSRTVLLVLAWLYGNCLLTDINLSISSRFFFSFISSFYLKKFMSAFISLFLKTIAVKIYEWVLDIYICIFAVCVFPIITVK